MRYGPSDARMALILALLVGAALYGWWTGAWR